MIFFVFNVVDPQLQIVQQRQVLQAVQHRREALAQRYLHVQTAVGLPQERENFVFLFESGGFFLNPLFQYRVAFRQLFRHGVERLAEHRHLVTPADMRALCKIPVRHGACHCQQLFPGIQQPCAQPDDGENQQQAHKQRHHPVDHNHPVNA